MLCANYSHGRPFKITMADGLRLDVPHPEFAMISGSGRIFYIAKAESDLFEAFDVLLITGVEQQGTAKPQVK